MVCRIALRSVAFGYAMGIVCLLLFTQATQAEDLGIAECVETQEDQINLILQLIDDCIINPNTVNLNDLAYILGEDSPPDFVRNLLQSVGTGSGSELGAPVRLIPSDIRRLGDGYSAEAIVMCQAGPTILTDTINFVFTTSGSAASGNSKRLALTRMENSVSQLQEFVQRAKQLGLSNRSAQSASASWYTPLDIGDAFSPKLLQQKKLYDDSNDDHDIEVLSATSSRDVLETRLFDRPYAAAAFRWLDPLKSFDLLVMTDANWDRIIVSGLYGEHLENRILNSYCSSGSGPQGLRSPTGIAWAGWQFWVADAYNDRVMQYSVNTSSNPPKIREGATVEYSEINTSTGDHLLNPIDVTANTFYVGNFAYPVFAILDQGNNRVVVHDPEGFHVRDDLNLLRPTAICMGRNCAVKEPNQSVYVADAGHNRVVMFYTQWPLRPPEMSDSTPPGMFPPDAFLSSIDSDNYGGIYVMDAAHSVVYKIASDLSSIDAKFGSEGTEPGQFLHPNRLTFVRGMNYENHVQTPLAIGEAVVTEQFGASTGVRRYSLGFDVLAHEATYIPKYTTYPWDFLLYGYYVTGHHYSRLTIKTQSGTLKKDFGWKLRRPGMLWFPPYEIPLNDPDNETYVFRLEAYSAFDSTCNTVISETMAVTRRTDVPTCEETVACRVQIDSLQFVSSDGCVYVDTSRWYRASVYWYDLCSGEEVDYRSDVTYFWQSLCLPHTEFCSDNAITELYSKYAEGYDSLVTCRPSVFVRFPFWPSTWPITKIKNTLCRVTVRALGESGARSPAEPTSAADAMSPEDVLHCGRVNFEDSISPNCTIADCCQDPPDPPDTTDPGCPYLYTWWGGKIGYQFVNNLLPQSEGLSALDADASDYYPIFLTSPVDTFYYKFLITEEEKEISKIDEFELVAYDIPFRRGDLRFTNQHDLVYLKDTLRPVSAVTDGGKDVLELFLKKDGLRLEAAEPGYVDLEYDLSKGKSGASLSVEEGDGGGVIIDPEPKGDPFPKVSGGISSRVPAVLTVSVLGDAGNSQTVDRVYPRAIRQEQVLSLPTLPEKGPLRLRLAWDRSVHLDHIPLLTFEKIPVTPVKLSLVSARHSSDGMVQSRLNTADGLRQTLMPGDSIELTYYAPPPDTMRRVFMFAAKGKYRTLTDREYAQLTEDPVTDYEFGQNYPNPFNPVTSFKFGLPQAAHVTLEVYNILGQKVATLTDREYPPGRHSVDWDTRQASGAEIASGVYFARFSAGDYTATQKMVVVK